MLQKAITKLDVAKHKWHHYSSKQAAAEKAAAAENSAPTETAKVTAEVAKQATNSTYTG